MHRSSLGLVACAALLGCAPCPDGEIMTTYRWTVCDDRTRECTDFVEERCTCNSAVRECPSGPSRPCDVALSGTGEWESQEMSAAAPHVIDGQFTGGEWLGATTLEGLFTDVYLDYRDGRLYFLNDWRANDEGIRPDCFNYFQIRLGDEWIDLRVFGSGEVQVRRDEEPVSIEASGAYGFGPSPGSATPHTIYEFSLAVDEPEIAVCCIDPLTESSCERLSREPMAVSIRTTGGAPQVRRQIAAGSVPRLGAGDACGDQQGICADGLRCDAARRICVAPAPPPVDAGMFDAGPPI